MWKIHTVCPLSKEAKGVAKKSVGLKRNGMRTLTTKDKVGRKRNIETVGKTAEMLK